MALEQLIFAFDLIGIYGAVLLAPVVFAVLWLKRDKKLSILFVFSFIITSLIVYGLKFSFQVPRPNTLVAEPFYDTSFPSTHSARAFLYSIFLSRKFEKFFQYVLYALAILTAIGRVVVGEHYPIDIIIGSIIGYLVSWFTLRYQNKILKLIKIR